MPLHITCGPQIPDSNKAPLPPAKAVGCWNEIYSLLCVFPSPSWEQRLESRDFVSILNKNRMLYPAEWTSTLSQCLEVGSCQEREYSSQVWWSWKKISISYRQPKCREFLECWKSVHLKFVLLGLALPSGVLYLSPRNTYWGETCSSVPGSSWVCIYALPIR